MTVVYNVMRDFVVGVKHRRDRAKLEISGCDFDDDGTWREFRLIVRNRGKSTARTCVGQLTVAPLPPFHITGDGRLTQRSITSGSGALSDATVHWAGTDGPGGISIHPEQSQRLVIGRARSRSPMDQADFTIPTDRGFDPALAVFSGPGYEYLARVSSEDAEPVLRFGQVRWSAQNPTIEVSGGPTPAFQPSLPRRPGRVQRLLASVRGQR